MEMDIEKRVYDEIAEMIHSDTSPVGFDAKRTHVYIVHMLQDIQKRLDTLERRLDSVEKSAG
jgi:translation elongation factor EF-1beta